MRHASLKQPEQAAIHALRSDLALQIARHVGRKGLSQSAAAARLGIPQPTLSKVMRGEVQAISLELLLRIAMRAGLPVVLQTGKDAAEAGVYAAGAAPAGRARNPSRLADEALRALGEGARTLTAGERLAAQQKHTELVTALHRAGAKAVGALRRNPR
jgi:predicted XRE-type DNA-binding protein